MIPLYISDTSLQDQFKEAKSMWNKVRKNGADDRTFTDGMWLNLIRWKMIELKKLIKKRSGIENLEGYDIPDRMNHAFMAKEKKK